MHDYSFAARSIHGLPRILIREFYRLYYGKDVNALDKSKLVKMGLSVLGMALTFGATLVNDKVKDAKLEETVQKKVQEALDNQND